MGVPFSLNLSPFLMLCRDDVTPTLQHGEEMHHGRLHP